jgi:hypothetical protein
MKYRFLQDKEPVCLKTDEQKEYKRHVCTGWKPISTNFMWKDGELFLKDVHKPVRRPLAVDAPTGGATGASPLLESNGGRTKLPVVRRRKRPTVAARKSVAKRKKK